VSPILGSAFVSPLGPSRCRSVEDTAQVTSFLRQSYCLLATGGALDVLGDLSASIHITADAVFWLTADVFCHAGKPCQIVGFRFFRHPIPPVTVVTVTKNGPV
jgi:hypothetical protein